MEKEQSTTHDLIGRSASKGSRVGKVAGKMVLVNPGETTHYRKNVFYPGREWLIGDKMPEDFRQNREKYYVVEVGAVLHNDMYNRPQYRSTTLAEEADEILPFGVDLDWDEYKLFDVDHTSHMALDALARRRELAQRFGKPAMRKIVRLAKERREQPDLYE